MTKARHEIDYGWGYMKAANGEDKYAHPFEEDVSESFEQGYQDGLGKPPIECYCEAPGSYCHCGG